MQYTIDKVQLVNRALIALGQPPSFAPSGESGLGGTVDLVWPSVIDMTFPLADWTFCRKTYKLARLTEEPQNGWIYGYALPGDRLGDPYENLSWVDQDSTRPLRNFRIEAGRLFANEPQAWSRVQVEVEPGYWDPRFRAAFVVALAAELAVPVSQDPDLSDYLRKKAFGTNSERLTGGLFGRLISQTAAAEPDNSHIYDCDPLTEARY